MGSAVTAAFRDAGWRVVVPWIVEAELERVDQHPDVHPVRADLFEPDSAAEVAGIAAADADAPLGAVVNLVGGFASGGRVHETDVEEFEKQLRLNLRPTYVTCQATIPHLIAAGGGAIVCVSSRAALQPFPGAAGYVTAKAAVLAFVDVLAAEYTKDGIRANAVLPSVIDTPANRAAMPKADHSTWVRPAEIAQAILFLCADGSSVIGGAHVPVYGRA